MTCLFTLLGTAANRLRAVVIKKLRTTMRHLQESWIALPIAVALLLTGCGKDPEQAPSNRQGYTDAQAADAVSANPSQETAEAPASTVELPGESNGFVVEADAPTTKEAACKLSEDLRAKRINNRVVKVLGEEKYKVVVGNKESKDRAEALLKKVVGAGYKKAQVAPSPVEENPS
jgi:hypothetical protein